MSYPKIVCNVDIYASYPKIVCDVDLDGSVEHRTGGHEVAVVADSKRAQCADLKGV